MTMLGKVLVFITLVLGIGVAIWSTSIYTQRPGWLSEFGDADKGQYPVSIKQLEKERDVLARAAGAASAAWGNGLKALQDAEQLRAERYAKMFGKNLDGSAAKARGLLDIAVDGEDLKDPDSPGFFILKTDDKTKRLDLDDRSVRIKGPDNKDLRGANKLLQRFEADSKALIGFVEQSGKLREQQKTLGDEIILTETRILKQQNIRDNLRNEAQYLADFEVNATENRETVKKRRDQLRGRLAPFGN